MENEISTDVLKFYADAEPSFSKFVKGYSIQLY